MSISILYFGFTLTNASHMTFFFKKKIYGKTVNTFIDYEKQH